MHTKIVTLIGTAATAAVLSGCSALGGENLSGDPVLTDKAEQACKRAFLAKYSLGWHDKYTFDVSGDFNPNFSVSATANWSGAGKYRSGNYSFVCTGRFDDDHMVADAVMDGPPVRVGDCIDRCP